MSTVWSMPASSQNARRCLDLALQSNEWADFLQLGDCSLVLTP